MLHEKFGYAIRLEHRGEPLAYRSSVMSLISAFLLRPPPKMPGVTARCIRKTVTPPQTSDILLAATVADVESPAQALFRAKRSTVDEALRLAADDVVAMQGGAPRSLEPLFRRGGDLLSAAEGLIRAAIDEPDDFRAGGRFSQTCLIVNTRSMEAILDLPLYGETQRLEYSEPGAHRGEYPYFRNESTLDGPFFAEIGRMFHMGAR